MSQNFDIIQLLKNIRGGGFFIVSRSEAGLLVD